MSIHRPATCTTKATTHNYFLLSLRHCVQTHDCSGHRTHTHTQHTQQHTNTHTHRVRQAGRGPGRSGGGEADTSSDLWTRRERLISNRLSEHAVLFFSLSKCFFFFFFTPEDHLTAQVKSWQGAGDD